MRTVLRRLLPRGVFRAYHRLLAWLAALWYGFPGDRLVVVGVTGTNGKSTVVRLIADIFQAAGYRVGLTSTTSFRIGSHEWLNATKMTMLGRFALQHMLRRMVRAGCEIAIVETSSEGIAQFRHCHIAYDVAVFTNLTPEHVESHGSFQAYRAAKGELFATLSHTKKKTLRGRRVPKTIVLNAGDPESTFFRSFPAERYIGFRFAHRSSQFAPDRLHALFIAEHISVTPEGSSCTVRGHAMHLALLSEANVENALAALAATAALDVPLETALAALAHAENVNGRFEFIQKEPFGVMVDYAPEPASMTALYRFLEKLSYRRIIHVLGSTGGGRDVSRRPILGQIAGEHAAVVIVTNEDPYDDDPQQIIDNVAQGAQKAGKMVNTDLFLILDRRAAIAKALSEAREGDLVLITGKGAEQAMVVAGGKKVPWDDRVVARELLAHSHA